MRHDIAIGLIIVIKKGLIDVGYSQDAVDHQELAVPSGDYRQLWDDIFN